MTIAVPFVSKGEFVDLDAIFVDVNKANANDVDSMYKIAAKGLKIPKDQLVSELSK